MGESSDLAEDLTGWADISIYDEFDISLHSDIRASFVRGLESVYTPYVHTTRPMSQKRDGQRHGALDIVSPPRDTKQAWSFTNPQRYLPQAAYILQSASKVYVCFSLITNTLH